MNHKKRGQIALFIVLGIVLVAAVILIYIFWNVSGSDSTAEEEVKQKFLNNPKDTARIMVESCLQDVVKINVEKAAKNGGVLEPDMFRTYYKKDYTYWCLDEGVFGCVNRVISRKDVETILAGAIAEDMEKCLDWSGAEAAGYEVKKEKIKLEVTIAPLQVNTLLHMPIIMTRGNEKIEQEEFSSVVESEFGTLFELALQILYSELTQFNFDKDNWMREHSSSFVIQKHRAYPDSLYELAKYNDHTKEMLTFRFGMQGKDTVAKIGEIFRPIGLSTCRLTDKTVFAQVKSDVCDEKGGQKIQPPRDWIATAVFSGPSPSEDHNGCGMYSDGESWCEYQSPVGTGLDYVGSRHYLKSCHNGIVYLEECRDYREEICVQTGSKPFGAVCRPNRWHDCSEQNDQTDCENDDLRDCTWNGDLIGRNHLTYGKMYTEQLCHPEVPPGFKFWLGGNSEQDVCAMANEQVDCDGFSCPQNWVDTSAIYCYSQGDCGSYRNVNNEVSRLGFKTTDTHNEPGREYIFLPDEAIYGKYVLTLRMDVPPLISYQANYENNDANSNAIMQGQGEFMADAATWDECTTCSCTGGVPDAGCGFKQSMRYANMCGIWIPPLVDDTCNVCGDKTHPCTEYWCKSLGVGCFFRDDNDGIGSCTNSVPGGPPLKVEELDISGNNTMIPDKFFYKGSEIMGHRIVEPLKPYGQVTLKLVLNRPARCYLRDFAAGMMSGEEYYVSTQAKINHTISLTAKPGMAMLEPFIENFGFANLAEAMTLDRVGERMQEFVNENPDNNQQNTIENWRDTLDPTIRESLEQMEGVIRTNAIETTRKITTTMLGCVDENGAGLPLTLIQFQLANDSSGPVLKNVSVRDDYFIATLDEPSECRYDTTNSSWSQMKYDMSCPTFAFTPPITCVGDKLKLNDTYKGPVFIRCRDQPSMWRNFSIRLNKTENFSYSGVFTPKYMKLIPPNIIILNKTSSGVSQLSPIDVNTHTARLSLRFKKPKTCRFLVPALPSSAWQCRFFGNAWGCEAEVPTNVARYTIKCQQLHDFNELTHKIII